VALTTSPPSRASCLEIWEPQPAGALRAVQTYTGDCFSWFVTNFPNYWQRNCHIFYSTTVGNTPNQNIAVSRLSLTKQISFLTLSDRTNVSVLRETKDRVITALHTGVLISP